MTQSTSGEQDLGGLHVAIIMDGNGRWARARGWPRIAGHRAGGESVRRVVEAAPDLGIRTLTLFAFSSDNWQRPPQEVSFLMGLFETYLGTETENCRKNGIRLSVIGRRDRLPAVLLRAIERTEAATSTGKTLHLRVAVDYSARDMILRAVKSLGSSLDVSREAFSRQLARVEHSDAPSPDVDLLIRTGGEQRLSDFLLWESAYAELIFTQRMWPDFNASDLETAVKDFHMRERRFGRVLESKAG